MREGGTLKEGSTVPNDMLRTNKNLRSIATSLIGTSAGFTYQDVHVEVRSNDCFTKGIEVYCSHDNIIHYLQL